MNKKITTPKDRQNMQSMHDNSLDSMGSTTGFKEKELKTSRKNIQR